MATKGRCGPIITLQLVVAPVQPTCHLPVFLLVFRCLLMVSLLGVLAEDFMLHVHV